MLDLLTSPEALAFYVIVLTFAAGRVDGKNAWLSSVLAWLAATIRSRQPKK